MVALKELKRKRTQKTAFDKSSRYPTSFQLSSLFYQQAPVSLALSSQSALVSTSTRPHPHQTSTISGDIYHLETPIKKRVIQQVKDYHKHHTITHLEWNPKGTVLLSIDEVGHLALWQMKTSVHDWEKVYKEDLKQPVIACLWFPSDRKYTWTDKIKREGWQGPWNPYGPLSFMTVTVHGIVTVHFQQSTTRFSQFSSALPSSHRHKKMREAGCYSLSLMGIDRWERISHASLLSKDNQIYLATYTDRAIKIYTIQIQFPKRHHEKSLVCRMLTSTSMACFDDGYYLTQLAWIEQTGCLVVGMASQQETSRLSQYTLETVQTTCTSHLGTVERQQTELKQMDSIEIKTGFISALQSNRNGQLVVGLSDGRVYYQPKEGTLASLLETALMVEPLEEMVVDLVLSPNQTHLIYQLESMTLGVIQLPDTLSLETIEQQLQLCLLNNYDYLDLVSYLIHTYTEDQTDTVLHHVLLKHQQYMPSDMAEWSLAQREKPFGLAMAIYKRIPNRQIQFTHFSRAVQLPLILDCFESSQNEEGQFDISSLWSLVSLSQWIYDYLQWLLREWYLLFHSLPHDLETEHVHAVLLLHPESRQCLVKILRKMEQWIQFCQTSNLIPLDNRLLLQRYTLALVHHDIALSETIGFLEALNSLSCPFEDPWSLLIHSDLKSYNQAEIQAVSKPFQFKCAKPSVYIQPIPRMSFDVVCKRRIQQCRLSCMRCQQPILVLTPEDPCASVQWYQSLKGYHCICGGLTV